MEVSMRRVNLAAAAAVITLGLLGGCAMPVSERSVTAYEGARLIVGDGRVIENATVVVEGTKIAQVGASRRCSRARRRQARRPRRQERDADDRRHPRPSQRNPRGAHTRLEAARLLRRERGVEHGQLGRIRPAQYARRDDCRRCALSHRGAGRARIGPSRGAPTCPTGLRLRRKAARRSRRLQRTRRTSSRSGSTTGTASTRS